MPIYVFIATAVEHFDGDAPDKVHEEFHTSDDHHARPIVKNMWLKDALKDRVLIRIGGSVGGKPVRLD